MFLLAASLLFTNPLPLDMPRAEGYLVQEKGVYSLEDRFNKLDLWISQSVDGRWMDEDGRLFTLAHLDVLPPEGEAAQAVATRQDYAKGLVTIDRRDLKAVRTAVGVLCSAALPSVELPERETRPHQLPRGFKDVDYWQGTNESVIVCAYLPEREKVWRLAVWELVEDDDFDDCLKLFERELFEDPQSVRAVTPRPGSSSVRAVTPRPAAERELLRADARHAVAAYPEWRVTDAEEFSVLDALPEAKDFIVALTNDLSVMRRRYAETLPTSIDGSNALCVARIYENRGDYLDALRASGLTNMEWSAAYWSPSRRELVAYSPGVLRNGDATSPSRGKAVSSLLSTIRHEAFHQYLSYATAMLPVSPWLNEGYAEYFENEEGNPDGGAWWEMLGETKPSPEDLERYAKMLPALLLMDYDAFYSGTDGARRLKYALARSLASFLEKGAPLVRFKPFKDVKRDYFAALFETRDMREATKSVFKDRDFLEKFTVEWTRYWKAH